jgi:hypothetical protein
VFDLFFYPADGVAEVLHLEARGAADADPVAPSACLQRLAPGAGRAGATG